MKSMRKINKKHAHKHRQTNRSLCIDLCLATCSRWAWPCDLLSLPSLSQIFFLHSPSGCARVSFSLVEKTVSKLFSTVSPIMHSGPIILLLACKSSIFIGYRCSRINASIFFSVHGIIVVNHVHFEKKMDFNW